MRIGDARFGNYVADGAEGVEAFCYGPGEALLFCFVLDVARGEVDGDEVACSHALRISYVSSEEPRRIIARVSRTHTVNCFDCSLRVPRVKVPDRLAYDKSQFDFIV